MIQEQENYLSKITKGSDELLLKELQRRHNRWYEEVLYNEVKYRMFKKVLEIEKALKNNKRDD